MQKTLFALYMLFLSLSFITACGKDGSHKEKIASVNDTTISLEEFQKEVSILSRRNPTLKITPNALEEHLNAVIDKKLLLQEARKQGLTENPRFAETIKTFWEQTLIKELIDLKTREWAGRLFATEEEVNKHYQRMQYMPTVRLAKAKNKEQAVAIKEKMLKKLPVAGEDTVGPLFIEDVGSSALLNAFDMDAGEIMAYETDGGYIVISVVKSEKTELPTLKESYDHIKEYIVEQKKQGILEEWLKNVKGAAKIQINAGMLKGLANEQ
ncbi:MAG: SurA N-terminal domain-containing protein [Deltaproteobacteria bacterium]|nr:SurA N-terminal domain-containing protein [Deltaproteobacteria bacterium]